MTSILISNRKWKWCVGRTNWPRSCQSLCHTIIIVLGDTDCLLHLLQHLRLSSIKSHYRSQFGYSINLTVVLTSYGKKDTSFRAVSLNNVLVFVMKILPIHPFLLCLHPHFSGSPSNSLVSTVPRWAAEVSGLVGQTQRYQYFHLTE